MPFYSEEKELTFKYTILGDYIMEGDSIFESLSYEVKDLIARLLESSADERITVDQAIQHPWFTAKSLPQKKINPGSIDFTEFV